MEQHFRPYRWTAFLFAIVLALGVGFFAYNAGVAHGIATTVGQAAAPPAPGGFGPYGYGWYRPWGFGFGLFGPFFTLLFFIFVMRALFWGGPWRRYGCYPRRYYEGPTAFDEWHRSAHERMTKEPAGPTRDDNRPRG